MAKTSGHTIMVKDGDTRRKFCKLIFGADGSYYVTAPYHSAKRAILFKLTVNYDTNEQLTMFEEAIELAELDEGRLKISHHPSGFVQYSGNGVVSGQDEDGNPKGLGVFSAPLSQVGRGPAISVGVQDITHLELSEKNSKHDVLFNMAEVTPMPGSNGVILEAHYFQPSARRFVFMDSHDRRWINVTHPNGIVIPMRVVLAPTDCDYPGLIAFEFYRQTFNFGESGFTLCGPGEKARMNAAGERIADVLMCFYPRPADFENVKSLDYRQGKP